MKTSKAKIVLAALFLGAAQLDLSAEELEELIVPPAGLELTNVRVAYSNITLHGNLTIGAGAIVTNLGTRVDIGPDEGQNVTLRIKDGGRLVLSEDGQSSSRQIVIGANGGAGKIHVSQAEGKKDSTGWNNAGVFAAKAWVLVLSSNASTNSDVMDIVQIDTNAFFSCHVVSNGNAQVRARILFNGGEFYHEHRCKSPFFIPREGAEILLKGVNGNDVKFNRMCGGCTYFAYNTSAQNPPSGLVRLQGDCDLVFNGSNNDMSPTMRGGFIISSAHLTNECTGDVICRGTFVMELETSGFLPASYGQSLVLDGPNTLLRSVQQLNLGVLGTGVVSNTTKSASVRKIMTPNAPAELRLEDVLSPNLVWAPTADLHEYVMDNPDSLYRTSFLPPIGFSVKSGTLNLEQASLASNACPCVRFKTETTGFNVIDSEFDYAKVNYGPHTAFSVGAGGILKAADCEIHGVSFAVGSTLETSGSGLTTVYDTATPFAGRLLVRGGTTRFSARGVTNDYWRFTFKDSRKSDGTHGRLDQFSGMVLLRPDQTALSGGITHSSTVLNQISEAAADTPAANLSPGQITAPAIGNRRSHSSSASGSLKQLVSCAQWQYLSFLDVFPVLGQTASYFPVTIRLPVVHDSVDALGVLMGWGTYYPYAWSLESSPDGENWTTHLEVENEEDFWVKNSVGYSSCKYLANYFREGAVGLSASAVVRVDEGATLDLTTTAGHAIGGLEVDWTQGGGTITHFEPVANGVLKIENFPEDASIDGCELPLTFGGVSNASNLSTWKLVVNGVEEDNPIAFSGGKILIPKRGTILFVR